MTSDYVIVSIKLRPKVESDEYIFLSKFGDHSMSDLEVIKGVSEATPGRRKRKKHGLNRVSSSNGFARVKFVKKLIREIPVEDFCSNSSLRKPPTFRDATTKLLRKMTSKHRAQKFHTDDPDLGSASDWLKQISHAERPIRGTTRIFVVTRHQYGISALVLQTSFRRETSGGVSKCRLFSQATLIVSYKQLFI